MVRVADGAVIRTEDVVKEYKDEGVPVRAVRGIDLTIEEGEFTAIVGPSGSGKTTFLNLISGLDDVTSGKVWLHGRLLSEMTGGELSDFRRDNIGFIFQAYNLIPVLSVEENVEYVMLLQGVSRRERHERVARVLGDLGLDGFAGRRPTRLSGGQQQRVAVARAVVSRPAIVLADEPTANLDSETAGELMDMMRRLNEENGITFVFSTHDRLVMERARRLVTLKDGMIDSDDLRDRSPAGEGPGD
jgi:putative ABC transport system ATP-binding protein